MTRNYLGDSLKLVVFQNTNLGSISLDSLKIALGLNIVEALSITEGGGIVLSTGVNSNRSGTVGQPVINMAIKLKLQHIAKSKNIIVSDQLNSSIISTKPIPEKSNFKSIHSDKTNMTRSSKKSNLDQTINIKLTPRKHRDSSIEKNTHQDSDILKIGELLLYGKCLMSKYLNNHVLNTTNQFGNWFQTGDIVEAQRNRITFKARREYIFNVGPEDDIN